MRLSQGQLNLLETCPRKFQHSYLEQLGAPNSIEQQARLMAGSQFHKLMQQWEMGLSIEAFLQEDAQLCQWFYAFIEAAPSIVALENHTFRQSEHLRLLEFNGHVITVVYDLLILTEQEGQILDWKTYPKPLRSDRIAQSWQTRLYPFVLAESSDYAPEQISMTYWFFQAKGDAQSLRLPYSRTKHEETRQVLDRQLIDLNGWLDRYITKGEFFPQVPETTQHCAECGFSIRCQRAQESQHSFESSNVAEIKEVRL